MRVLVVSEGKHEQAGALENLLRRLGADKADFTFDRVSNNAIHAWNGTGPGHFKRAVGWLKEAERRGVDALVLLIDDDRKKKEQRSRQIADAQDSQLSQLPRAMGVAIRTFDAWMLADEVALTRVLGRKIDRQADPETVPDPKEVCQGLLKDLMAQSKMYAEIAGLIDIGVLSRRCRKGFRPFAEHVKRMYG